MWADVRIPDSGNDSRDAVAWGLDGFWAHCGAYSWRRPNSLWFFCFEQDLVLPLELFHFVLGSVVPLLLVIDMFGVLCTFISQTPYSLYIHVCDALLNWFYLFNWDVTYNITKFKITKNYRIIKILKYIISQLLNYKICNYIII